MLGRRNNVARFGWSRSRILYSVELGCPALLLAYSRLKKMDASVPQEDYLTNLG